MPRRSQIELKPNNNQQRLSREEISIFKRKFSEVAEDIDHPFRNIKLNYEELIKIVEEVTQKILEIDLKKKCIIYFNS